MSAVGNRIASRRRELGLSQRELAEPGVSYAYISRIEKGARNPSVKVLRKIAPPLGVSVAWLETGEDDLEAKLLGQCARLWDMAERSLALLEQTGARSRPPAEMSLLSDLRAELRRDRPANRLNS